MKCIKGKELGVHKSNAGFYIGVVDEEGPLCRISEEYYETRELAELLLKSNAFVVRDCIENNFCNGEKSCLRKPSIEIDIDGPDGNIFAIMALANKAMRAEDMLTDGKAMYYKVTKCLSYAEALDAVREYVDIIEV